MTKLARLLPIAAAAAALLAALPAAAQTAAGSTIVRLRAVEIDPANSDDTGLGLSVNRKTIPELDFSYFFAPNLAAELVLTVPQKHTVHSSLLAADIGSLKHLPPTLTLQYHFTGLPLPNLRPYVGAGVNYTRFSSVVLPTGYDIKRSSVGGALQLGADWEFGGGWLLNVDVKKVWINTDVTNNGAKIGNFKVDPTLVGVGIGKRF